MNSDTLPPPGHAQRLKVKLYCLLIVGSFYYVPAALVAINKRIKDNKRKLYLFLGLLCVYLMPLSQSELVRDLPLWEDLRRYFQVKIINPQNLPANTIQTISSTAASTISSSSSGGQTVGSLFSVVPHGIVPFPLGLLQFGYLNKLFSGLRISMASVVQVR